MKKRTFYTVYDMEDNERLIGVFTTDELCKLFDLTSKSRVYHLVSLKRLLFKRYKIESIQLDNEE